MNQKYNYDGNDVTFHFGNGDVMINATEMARPFGKRAGEWLRLPSTTNFLAVLEAMGKSHRSNLVVTENGIGTWMHEDAALEFARWLSPMFAIWCNDRIKELAKYGFTATETKIEQLVANPELLISLATQLQNERKEKNMILQHNSELKDIIQSQQPRVRFSQAVEASVNSVLVSDLAKVLTQKGFEIGQNRLFKILRNRGYLLSKGEYWNQPSQKAMELGLFQVKKQTILKADGSTLSTTTPMVTGRGQVYFINKFLNEKMMAI